MGCVAELSDTADKANRHGKSPHLLVRNLIITNEEGLMKGWVNLLSTHCQPVADLRKTSRSPKATR
jgi:hypothetical protein